MCRNIETPRHRVIGVKLSRVSIYVPYAYRACGLGGWGGGGWSQYVYNVQGYALLLSCLKIMKRSKTKGRDIYDL